MEGNKQKWATSFERFEGWNTPWQRRVQEQEARLILSFLLGLQLPRYDILEIGCGNGYLGSIIAHTLLEKSVPFSYHFSDLIDECVGQARKEMQAFPHQNLLKFSVLDAYNADKGPRQGSQSIIISTGFASAATYRDVVPVVASALKPDGVLVADFVNHLSPLVFLSRPLHSFRLLRGLLLKKEHGDYHFGILGIRKYFSNNGLLLERCATIRWRRNPLLCMFRKHVV